MTPDRLIALLQEIEPQRIAIIKPSALGDVVQTLPLLRVLKKKYPGVEIDWIIRSELADLLKTQADITRIIPFHRKGGWNEWNRLLYRLWQRKYDITFDLQGLLRSGIMTAATRASLRVGIEAAREGSSLACHGLLPGTDLSVPANTRYWKLAEYLGLGQEPQTLQITISPEVQQSALQLLSGLQGPLLMIHAGAMWETKRWPAHSFAEVAVRAIDAYQMQVVVVGTKSEQAEAELITHTIRDATGDSSCVRNLAGKTSLQELAVVLQQADLMLTNDSGPMHLAAAIGTPVVGIFTCTSAVRSGPAGQQHELVQAKVPCAATYRKQCPHSGSLHMHCLQAVSIFQVWSAVQKAVQKNQLLQRVA